MQSSTTVYIAFFTPPHRNLLSVSRTFYKIKMIIRWYIEELHKTFDVWWSSGFASRLPDPGLDLGPEPPRMVNDLRGGRSHCNTVLIMY